jgi:hypothetical protein
MADTNQDLFEKAEEGLRFLERDLGLPERFLGDLLVSNDDWSFVIKIHALLEASVTHHLVAQTDLRLRSVFERLEMSDPRAGKVAFARSLGLLSQEEQTFVRQLSELRNRLVHDPRNVSFDLKAHVAAMDPNQLRAFKKATSCSIDEEEKRRGFETFAEKEPKMALWAGAIKILSGAVEASVKAAAMRGLQEVIDDRAAKTQGRETA